MKQVSPSMMCVPIDKLRDYLQIFEHEKIEWLHIDIMDGAFVPNYTLGTDYVKQLRKLTPIPLDVHLMVCEPIEKLNWFDFQPGEMVSVHVEACTHLQSVLSKIRSYGAKAAVALNPSTPLNTLDYILDDLDALLIMTVNPGFAGQKAIPAAIDKILQAKEYLQSKGYPHIQIEVDGNVSYDLSAIMSQNGADILVAGTSAFLTGLEGLGDGIRKFRSAI